jgi:hypothetical protein
LSRRASQCHNPCRQGLFAVSVGQGSDEWHGAMCLGDQSWHAALACFDAFHRNGFPDCCHQIGMPCLLLQFSGVLSPCSPTLLQAVCTRWGCDPMAYGSYSSVAVGSAGAADYEALATPLGNTVFFAGEATTSR